MLEATSNLLTNLPEVLDREQFDILLNQQGVRLERILSTGHSSPPGEWYDQSEAEWVLLLQGSARLRFEEESEDRILAPGDAVFIPPHCRHRVEETSPTETTVWLALFLPANGSAPEPIPQQN